MAKIEIVTLTDSLDERIKSNVETVTFFNPITGTKMEIELGEANRKHFGNHLAKLESYIAKARTVEAAPKKTAVAASKGELGKVREWAKKNGHDVGERGRIKAEIVEAYHAAVKDETMDRVMGGPEPVTEDMLESALENSAAGNVQDLGDFTVYAQDEPIKGSQEAANGTDDAWQGDGPSDADILAMMAEIDSDKGNVTLEDLDAAVDSKSSND